MGGKTEKRQKIMQAAEALFSRGRIHEITMDEVARKAGVGKGTLYRYFSNKDDLFSEVALSGYDELCEVIAGESRGADAFRTRLVRVCRRVSDFYRGRHQLMHMMQAEERRALWQRGKMRDLWMSRRRQLVSALAAILKQGCEEAQIRSDVDVDVLAVLLLGMLRSRGRENCAASGVSIEHESVVDLFINGAACREPRGRGPQE